MYRISKVPARVLADVAHHMIPYARTKTKGQKMTNFKTKSGLALVGLLVIPALAFCGGVSAVSDPTPVLLDTDSYYLWHTATGGTMRVEWTFPLNATVASLAVTGRTFKVSIGGIRAEYADLELPTPKCAKDEDVLEFTLSFNDGSVKTATLGLVCGRAGSVGVTTPAACLASTNAPTWRHAGKYFVLPVPKDAETVLIAGEPVDTGLDGAAGWLALGPYAGGTTVPVSVDDLACDIIVYATGLVISYK